MPRFVPTPIAMRTPSFVPAPIAVRMPSFVPAPLTAAAAPGHGRTGRRDRQHQRGADQELCCCRLHRETRSKINARRRFFYRHVYAAHPESKKRQGIVEVPERGRVLRYDRRAEGGEGR
jgi:hypothetical protein